MDVSFFVQMGWKSALIAGRRLGSLMCCARAPRPTGRWC